MDEHRFRRVSFQTVGCRLNQYETEKMAADLLPCGLRRVDREEPADLYIINTCTVTHRADADSRSLVRRARQQNPDGIIVMVGCYVDRDLPTASGMEAVDAVLRNTEKESIAEILTARFPVLFGGAVQAPSCAGITDFHDHNRAWVKVSDGCNQACSFCIVPSIRGRLRNRPAQAVLSEISGLVEHGYEEVVLTGVNLGHYKDRQAVPAIKNLAALCRLIMVETDLKRLRLSSAEPQTIREELIDVYAQSNGRMCRHWHIPLQSGSPRILRLMRRPYDDEFYLRRAAQVKSAVPNTIIGADVIVGFPGESDEDFESTRRVCESGLIDYLHVFGFSARPGTPAVSLSEGRVPPLVVKHRVAVLTALSARLRHEANKRQMGQTLGVVSEHRKSAGGVLWGVADNYIKVKMPAWYESSRRIVTYRVTSVQPQFVDGDIVEPSR